MTRKGRIGRIIQDLNALVHQEPTCIRCGCTEFNACPEGCAWTFLNGGTNEGLCSSCFDHLKQREKRKQPP